MSGKKIDRVKRELEDFNFLRDELLQGKSNEIQLLCMKFYKAGIAVEKTIQDEAEEPCGFCTCNDHYLCPKWKDGEK